MAYKEKEGEVYPLLTTDWLGCPTYRTKPVAKHIRGDDEVPTLIEDDDEVFDIIDQKKKRNVNMVWIDVFLLALDFMQILALIQSMSLRWNWPGDWLRNTYWIFAFNADAWEMSKMIDGAYLDIQNRYVPSSDVSISFRTVAIGWFIAVAALLLIYAVVYTFIRLRFYPAPWARQTNSWLQYVYMIIIHVLTLPFGTVLFRIFQCEDIWNKMDTINDYTCWTMAHWELAIPAVIAMVLLFVIYPGYLIWKIRHERMSGSAEGYLSFILLKETEYKLHLNLSWLYDSCFLFSSFKYRGVYYRPIIQIMKALILIIYAAAFRSIQNQSMIICIFLFFAFLIFVFIRPYRLTSCNVFLIFNLLALTGDTFMGALRAAYDAYTLPTPWLLPQYLIWFIVAVQALWLASFIVLLIYLISRTLCHSTKSCYKRPVWPNISTSGSGQLTGETRKFMVAVIKAKIVQEKIIRVPVVFAPVHDLARHIHIINTYCREAEYLRDALHMILWQTLDGLVETHAELSPKSIFAESVKKSIRRTAAEFMKMVPMFSQRLAQRDYDFILVNPVKKRLLMKMYILGLFLNGRSERVAKKKMFDPAVGRVWPPLPEDKEFEEEDGYYEDLYPGPVTGTYSDDLLGVVVENASDEETSEEEDNVRTMLRGLPEVGLIDLESPEPEPEEERIKPPSPRPISGTLVSTHTGVKKFGVEFETNLRPPRTKSAASKSSSSSSSSSSKSSLSSAQQMTRQATGSLYNSVVSLRQDQGSRSSLSVASPLPQAQSPEAAGSVQSLRSPSPSGPRPSPASKLGRPVSASSGHSEAGRRSLSPSQRPPSAGSVISSQSIRPLSPGTELSDHEMAQINPGYIPEDESVENETEQAEEKEPESTFARPPPLRRSKSKSKGSKHEKKKVKKKKSTKTKKDKKDKK